MDLTRRQAARHPAMQVALDEAHRLLARGVVAESDVHLGIDQAGARGGLVGVHHHVAGFQLGRRQGADFSDLAVRHQDGITLRERFAPVPRDDGCYIDDGGLHGGFMPPGCAAIGVITLTGVVRQTLTGL